MAGKLYGLGLGPGDPELLTLKAHRILTSCPVVAYPALEDGASFARSIVADYLSDSQREIVIRIPMTVERAPAQQAYDRASLELARELDQGRDVAVLCEGDPFFYGSFMYLFGRLAERYPTSVVPGVTSLTACSAVAGAPLAARNDTLAVLPAPLPDEQLEARLRNFDAVAIIKPGRHFARIQALLDHMGLLDQARYVERATLENQRILKMRDVPDDSVPYFSMILVHHRGDAWK
ncbi:MAG: precorrin-2 C(20)-methyltransferase [Pseudomonadota bacterium]